MVPVEVEGAGGGGLVGVDGGSIGEGGVSDGMMNNPASPSLSTSLSSSFHTPQGKKKREEDSLSNGQSGKRAYYCRTDTAGLTLPTWTDSAG